MAECVVDLLETIQIDIQQRHVPRLLAGAGQRGFQAITQQLTIGQLRELIVLRHLPQSRVQLLALDRRGDLGADVLQQFFVLLGVTVAAGQAFDDQRADGAVFRVQRHTEPAWRILPRHQRGEVRWGIGAVGRQKNRLTTADNFRAQPSSNGARLFGLQFMIVDVIGKFSCAQCSS